MSAYTPLNGIRDVDKNGLMQQLQENLSLFFEWGLLEAGGYTDVSLDPSDVTGDDTLLPVHMPGQPDGRIWQAPHRNWVWERGLGSERQPVAVSGVYVDGTLHAPGVSGQFNYFINYPDGRVVFNQPIPTSSVVQAEYSYRWVNFYDQSVPWFRDVIFDALRYEIGDNPEPSGFIGLLQDNSVQLPAVIIESVATRRFIPKQLGDLTQWVNQDFIFHVLAENVEDRDFMIDVITLQKDVTFYLFDTNARAAANQFSLDWHGSPVSGALTYPQLLEPSPSGFQWNKCYFSKMVGQDTSARLPLYRATIRATLEVDYLG